MSWFSVWLNIARALPVGPSESWCVTSRAEIGDKVPIPTFALGAVIAEFLMLVVPVVAPIVRFVAAPPKFSVVTVVLKIFPVVCVLAIVPEFAYMSPLKLEAPVPRKE